MRPWWQDLVLNVSASVLAGLILSLVATKATRRYGLFDPKRDVDWEGFWQLL